MQKIFKILIIILLTHLSLSVPAQNKSIKSQLREYEDSLKSIAPEILYGKLDLNKNEASERFFNMLSEALSLRGSFNYTFDSLKTISILKSPDGYFRIFTWNLRKDDGAYDYFGLIQVNPKKTDGDGLFRLTNAASKNKGATKAILSCDKWYGAHYYKILQNKSTENTCYTLLGWDGNNNISTRKIIDVIVFNNSGQPEFGAPIFQTKTGLNTRHIIEYGAQVAVSLKYEKQYVSKGKNKKWMIVFDRITPLSPMLEGQYQFYVPETDTYDAFIFEKGIWQFHEDVDARNPKVKRDELDKIKKMQRQKKYNMVNKNHYFYTKNNLYFAW